MKLITLVLIDVSAIGALAQSNPQQKAPDIHIPGMTVLLPGPILNIDDFNLQTDCPLVFTNVDLKQTARYMPVKQGTEADDEDLVFSYKNQSGNRSSPSKSMLC